MKILLVNKFYYRRGGDCIYMLNLEQLLKTHGHDVAVFAMDYPENIETEWKRYFPNEIKFTPGVGMLETFMRMFGLGEVKRKFNSLLNDFKPDVVHLNNIHTQLSPVIARLAYERGIKVIWTLHDYKLLCPRYDCLRNGNKVCEECFADKHKVLEYKCMKNSKLASMLAYKEAMKWSREKLESYTDAFICPSQFMQHKMAQGEFDRKKMYILCNFIDIERTRRDSYDKEDYYCFIGRLSFEKGIETLIEAARTLPYHLKIIGGGPLADILKEKAKGANIEFTGYKEWPEIKEIVGKARFSVVPSEWYENNPLSVIEAQCLGTPVLGANIGGIPELIKEGVNGMCFESRNIMDLKNKIEKMFILNVDYKQLAKSSQIRYSSEKHYNELLELYQQ
ncbi:MULTISPECIES: glycosyltransferase [Bacteroides]|jgi:glycosyltransferase involved in cell wall biosynthesis|uniref:glycosyltransferase n=1 Tax=Bacteroides TaxID=816 RepID=UPI000E51CF70|nr:MULTISPECIES: glycosyltransferase [Bacteroides]MCS3202762.1 glycosyltransferase [Candidatus Bacteroides intestinigallinarum]QNL36954.1 glycosyltransferase [Bacteroides sp. M10]RGQ90135.1 glycosyltransferase [Bacteroides sp. AF26-7BH]RGY36651.1 glycosyltransferase [Bacteroides sp. OF02-3LB]